MFTKTRLTLTAWYLAIIMLVSFAFSIVIYQGAQSELQRSLRIQTLRFQRQQGIYLPLGVFPEIDRELLTELDNRIKLTLLLVNLGIFVFSGAAGYFLAGKTLRPIEKMVEEQKRFVADASHELRTPLTAMRTENEVALRDKKLNLEGAKQLLKSNLEETNKMQELSNYLLTLSRYQTKGFQFKKEPVDLHQVIHSVLETHQSTIKKRSIKIITKGQRVIVNAHKESLIELLNILVDNAIKYSFSKGSINIETQKTSTGVLLSVHDNGIGIKPNDLPHIFDRFYRAEPSRSKLRTDGYGLGLSIAKEIVDYHSGLIEVQSNARTGTTFKIKL